REEFLELAARDHRELARLERHHGGGSRPVVEHDLAEIFARTQGAEQAFLALLVREVDLDPTREDDEQGVAAVAFVDQDGVLRKGLDRSAAGQRRQRRLRQGVDRLIVLGCRAHGRALRDVGVWLALSLPPIFGSGKPRAARNEKPPDARRDGWLGG